MREAGAVSWALVTHGLTQPVTSPSLVSQTATVSVSRALPENVIDPTSADAPAPVAPVAPSAPPVAPAWTLPDRLVRYDGSGITREMSSRTPDHETSFA